MTPISNLTHDLLACNAVTEPTVPPRDSNLRKVNLLNWHAHFSFLFNINEHLVNGVTQLHCLGSHQPISSAYS